MQLATVSEGVTLSLQISETAYQLFLEELSASPELSFDDAADKAIAQWVLNRRNHRRMTTKLMLEAA